MKLQSKNFILLIVLLLFFTTGIHAEEIVCEVDRPSIVERVVNRSYPSSFTAFHHQITNEPVPESVWDWSYYIDVLPRRDLIFQGSFIGHVSFQHSTGAGTNVVFRRGESKDWVIDRRKEIQMLNPNFLYIAAVYYYGIGADRTEENTYSEEWPYWLRDEEGKRVHEPSWNQYLIDFTLPGAEDHFVKQAVSIAKCGIFDGIFLDLWADLPGTPLPEKAHLYHGNQLEAAVSLVKRIRESVGDDFLIIVNSTDRIIPLSAPYVNGAYMETWDKAYPRERLIELENVLSWHEENLRYPQVNCLEVAKNPREPWDSPANLRLARTITTLILTHSNGSVQVHGKPDFTAKYWYPFFDAPLGYTIGGNDTKGVLYETPKGMPIEGLFIREFTGGYAVYNRSGKERQVYLPKKVSGWASGVENKHWHTIGDMDGEIYLKSVATRTDVNADGIVNILDLVRVANGFNTTEPDLNGDGVVNVLDLVIVSNSIGSRK